MEKISIEKLTKDCVDDVFEIEKHFFGLEKNDSIVSSLDSKTLSYFVLKYDKKIIGFLECSIVLDEAELFDIAILEDWQGKHFSKNLMDFFFDFCKQNGVRTIFLEVNTNNIRAINLYKKYGFVQYSKRQNYYGDNDAILMKFEF